MNKAMTSSNVFSHGDAPARWEFGNQIPNVPEKSEKYESVDDELEALEQKSEKYESVDDELEALELRIAKLNLKKEQLALEEQLKAKEAKEAKEAEKANSPKYEVEVLLDKQSEVDTQKYNELDEKHEVLLSQVRDYLYGDITKEDLLELIKF